MSVQLAPESEAILNRLVASGAYSTPAAAVAAAVQLLEAQAERRKKHEELTALIQEGIESAERGELHDGEEVFEEILRDIELPTGPETRSL
jgi:antitoxin ParD1/3/4